MLPRDRTGGFATAAVGNCQPGVEGAVTANATVSFDQEIDLKLKVDARDLKHGGLASRRLSLAAATTLVFGAAYTLWMYKRVIFGAVANPHVAHLQDINLREFLVLGLLAVAVLGMGIYPAPFAELLHASVDDLLAHVSHSKIPTR